MSCVSPIPILNNSKKIYKNYRAKLINYVPCGKCYECRKEKIFQLMIRSYYNESKYIIFDTLSYSENNVSWLKQELIKDTNHEYELNIQNIRIIKYDDYQKFMKRLRKCISQKYNDVNLKYIVSAEYGHDKNYIDDNGRIRKGTARPHYHIILFVNGSILPVELSKIIKKCWKYGLTDGVDDKGLLYFNSQRLFKDYLAKKNVIGYLCKYVTKTNDYETKVKNILRCAENQIYQQIFKTNKNEDKINDIKKILKKYCQFVKWSKGFGNEFLENPDIDKLIIKNYIQIRTDLKNKRYNIPLYYKRKLFTNNVNGEIRLNENGIKYTMHQLNMQNEYNKQKLRLYTFLSDDKINEIAYYWTYIKDRNMHDGNMYYPDYNEYYNSENSVLDRKKYKNGKIEYGDTILNFEEFVKKSVENIEEYDKIILYVNEKIKNESLKVSEFKEKNDEIKKNTKKMLYV